MGTLESMTLAVLVMVGPIAAVILTDNMLGKWRAERPHRARLRAELDEIRQARRTALIRHRRAQITRNQQKGQHQ